MKSVVMPKGKACALHLTYEYRLGVEAAPRDTNPFNFWDEYEKHYAWDIGNQKSIWINHEHSDDEVAFDLYEICPELRESIDELEKLLMESCQSG